MVVITGTMIAGGLMAGASIYQARVAAANARKAAQSARSVQQHLERLLNNK